MKKLLTYILAVLTAFTAIAVDNVTAADSVKVLFRIGHRRFEPALGDNRAAMKVFIDRVKETASNDDIDSIVVRAYASPDGSNAANVRLARNRCETIVRYIAEHAGISSELIHSYPEGIAWDELRRIVAENEDVPSREKILDILDNTPVWVFDAQGKIIDGRKKQLMELRGGRPYRWMFENLFPQLRNSVAVILYVKSATEHSEPSEQSESSELSEPSEVSESTEHPELSESSEHSEFSELSGSSALSSLAEPRFEYPTIQRFALKTNLLYDAALMPNLELEYLINPRWSVALEGDVAWWKRESHHQVYRIAVVSPEVRRWIKQRDRFHGMYVGAFLGGGKYQLENGGNGYKGEGGMAGLSFGYMFPITRNLSFDAEIGAGYMYTRYKEYEPVHGHRVYLLTKSLNYFGPLKLKFSIAWRFDEKLKLSKPVTNL